MGCSEEIEIALSEISFQIDDGTFFKVFERLFYRYNIDGSYTLFFVSTIHACLLGTLFLSITYFADASYGISPVSIAILLLAIVYATFALFGFLLWKGCLKPQWSSDVWCAYREEYLESLLIQERIDFDSLTPITKKAAVLDITWICLFLFPLLYYVVDFPRLYLVRPPFCLKNDESSLQDESSWIIKMNVNFYRSYLEVSFGNTYMRIGYDNILTIDDIPNSSYKLLVLKERFNCIPIDARYIEEDCLNTIELLVCSE